MTRKTTRLLRTFALLAVVVLAVSPMLVLFTTDMRQFDDGVTRLGPTRKKEMKSMVKRQAYTVNQSLIRDPTILWDAHVDRVWLGPSLTSTKKKYKHPPAMLLLTNYGWNQKNQTKAIQQFGRRIRETELVRGVVNHPWFHPTAWEEYEDRKQISANTTIIETLTNNSTRFYVFLDVNTMVRHREKRVFGACCQLLL